MGTHQLIVTGVLVAAVVAALIDVAVVLSRKPLREHGTLRRGLLALAIVMPLPAAIVAVYSAPASWNHTVLLIAGPLALIVLFAAPIAFFTAITFTITGVLTIKE